MKTFTIEDIRKREPCYDPAKHLREGWSGTVLDILAVESAPIEDRLWVVLHEDFLSEKLLRQFAVWCARQVQHLMTDGRSIAALDFMDEYIKHRFAETDPDIIKEWERRRFEAWDAAWAAALAVARDAARAAAWAAASEAARYAAREAAWAAARAAARHAAREAARAAARAAASEAASEAARDAASEAARDAASEAARAAARAAASEAARAAARDAQLKKLLGLIIEGEKTGDVF